MDGRNVIEQLKCDEKKVRTKIEDLRKSIEKELSAAEVDLNHILGAISYYERESNETKQFMLANVAHEWELPKLRGMTHKEAVVAIAKKNNGIVRSQDAKRLMIRAGIMRETRNSSRMVHNAIKGTNLFDSIGPGEYRLKNPASETRVVESREAPIQ
jgi:hypothetical protein